MQMITQNYETLNLLKWEILMNIMKEMITKLAVFEKIDFQGNYRMK